MAHMHIWYNDKQKIKIICTRYFENKIMKILIWGQIDMDEDHDDINLIKKSTKLGGLTSDDKRSRG